MPEITIIVRDSLLGDVEITREDMVVGPGYDGERARLARLLAKATGQVQAAYGIPSSETPDA